MAQTPAKTRIGIIGVGPSGLAALKAVLESPQYIAGLWDEPIAFESKSNLGGVWFKGTSSSAAKVSSNDTQISNSPIYDSLTTNLPYPVMAYSSFPFPSNTDLYPTADVVQSYLESYAEKYNLCRYILLNTHVLSADWNKTSEKWFVDVETDRKDDAMYMQRKRYDFDMLMVCNGHYNDPRYPLIPGLDSWIDAGRASHSVYYRNPSSIRIPKQPLFSSPAMNSPKINPGDQFQHLENSTILVIGGGPSGSDISAELVLHAKRVLHSFSPTSAASRTTDTPSQNNSPVSGDKFTPHIIFKPRATQFSGFDRDKGSGTIYFEDGSREDDVHYCVLATGYKFAYPFFDTSESLETATSHYGTEVDPIQSQYIDRRFKFTSDLIPLPLNLSDIHDRYNIIPKSLYNTTYSIFPLAAHLFGLPGSGFSSTLPSATKICLPRPTSLAFLGLPIRVAPFPLVEVQARTALAAFAASNAERQNGDNIIDWEFERGELEKRWELLKTSYGELNKHKQGTGHSDNLGLRTHLSKEWHRFGDESIQFEYRDRLDDLAWKLQSTISINRANIVRYRVKRWEPEMYGHKAILRQAWIIWARKYGPGSIREAEGVKMRRNWSTKTYGGDEDEGVGEPGNSVRFMRGLLEWYNQ